MTLKVLCVMESTCFTLVHGLILRELLFVQSWTMQIISFALLFKLSHEGDNTEKCVFSSSSVDEYVNNHQNAIGWFHPSRSSKKDGLTNTNLITNIFIDDLLSIKGPVWKILSVWNRSDRNRFVTIKLITNTLFGNTRRISYYKGISCLF